MGDVVDLRRPPPRARIEVRGEVEVPPDDPRDPPRQVLFGRRLAIDRGAVNAELALVTLDTPIPITVEVRGTLQDDGLLWVNIVLEAGPRCVDAVSAVADGQQPCRFELDVHGADGTLAAARGSISSRAV